MAASGQFELWSQVLQGARNGDLFAFERSLLPMSRDFMMGDENSPCRCQSLFE